MRRDELEQPPRVGIEAAHAPLDHLLERRSGVQEEGVGVRGQALRVHASSEVLDEERASSRSACDGVGHEPCAVVAGAHQVERELPRVFEPERANQDAPDVGALEALLEELLQERARLGVAPLPLPEDEQEARGVRRPHDLGEQGGAVDVAPVHVVEVHHHRSEPRHLRKQRSKRRERLLSHALGVVDGASGQRRDRLDPPQDGEETRERPRVRRQRDRGAALLERDQAAAERVDHAVDRLVGDRLAFVRAAAQDHGVAPRRQPLEEVLHERRLAHARRAPDAHDHAAAGPGRDEGLVQGLQLGAAPYERPTMAYPGDGRGAKRSALADAESREHLTTGGSLFRRASQELAAEGVEILGDAVDEVARRRRLDHRLAIDDVDRIPHERGFADERFVEEDAHAVPVARVGQRLVEGLLRSHVHGRADDVALEQPCVDHPGEIRRHAEVEEDDATVFVDEHVGGLDVAVDLSRRMERVDSLRELTECVPQPVHVRRRLPSTGRGTVQKHGRRRFRDAATGPAGLLDLVGRPAAAGRRRGSRRRRERLGTLRVDPEILPRDELHRQEDAVGLGRDELVEAYEVAMQDVRERPEFLFEQVESARTEAKERLDRDSPILLPVVGLVDDAHSSVADAPQHLISSRPRPGKQVALVGC